MNTLDILITTLTCKNINIFACKWLAIITKEVGNSSWNIYFLWNTFFLKTFRLCTYNYIYGVATLLRTKISVTIIVFIQYSWIVKTNHRWRTASNMVNMVCMHNYSKYFAVQRWHKNGIFDLRPITKWWCLYA